MTIEFRRTLGGDAAFPVKDYPLEATYALTAAKGDLVKTSAGAVVKSVLADVSVLGIYEGPNVKLAAESPTGKVRVNNGAVYEVTYTNGTPAIGLSYAFLYLGDGTVGLNVAITANPTFKVLSVNTAKSTAEVIIHSAARIIG